MKTGENLFFLNILPMNDLQLGMDYRPVVESYARESAGLGFRHTLITHGHKRHDPFTVAQYGMERSRDFSPLIAVNSLYQHPLHVAKKIISLASLYPDHRLALNLIAGSFAQEMKAMVDTLDFDQRSARLLENLQVLKDLLSSAGRSDFQGEHYSLDGAEVFPKWNADRSLNLFVSGSLKINSTTALSSTFFVKNMRPIALLEDAPGTGHGLGLGICARSTQDEAEAAVRELFPKDRAGELMFSLALSNLETPWNRWLKTFLPKSQASDLDFYLEPLKSFRSAAPYLVGSYDHVAKRLHEFTRKSYGFFLIDYAPGDGTHVKECLQRTLALSAKA